MRKERKEFETRANFLSLGLMSVETAISIMKPICYKDEAPDEKELNHLNMSKDFLDKSKKEIQDRDKHMLIVPSEKAKTCIEILKFVLGQHYSESDDIALGKIDTLKEVLDARINNRLIEFVKENKGNSKKYQLTIIFFHKFSNVCLSKSQPLNWPF